MLKNYFFILLFLMTGLGAQAQQLLGGDISYTHIDSGKYQINLSLYRACSDSMFNSMKTITVSGIDLNTSTVAVQRVSITDLSSQCADSISPCLPQNGIGKGLERHIYQTILNLDTGLFYTGIQNGACKIYFSYKGNFRKGNYLTTIDSIPLEIFSMLDVCELKRCEDTSTSNVQFVNPPDLYLNQNSACRINIGGLKLTKDEIEYEPYCNLSRGAVIGFPCAPTSNGRIFLTDYCLPGTSRPCTPIPSINPPIGTYQDVSTGDLTFQPTIAGEQGEYFIKSNQYRRDTNGIRKLIGFGMRSVTFIVDSSQTNKPPSILGPYAHTICEGKELCFDIQSKDADVSDTTSLTIEHNLSGATFVYKDSTAREKTGKLCWTPAVGDYSSNIPYNTFVTVKDNACPNVGSSKRTYSITVKRRPRIDSISVKLQNCSKVICKGFGTALAGSSSSKWKVLDLNDSILFSRLQSIDTFTLAPDGGVFIFEYELSNSTGCTDVMRDTVTVAPSLKMVDLSTLNRCYGFINDFPAHGPVKNYPNTINQIGPVIFSLTSLSYALFEDTITPFRTYGGRIQKVLVSAKDSIGCINTDTSELLTHFSYRANLGSDQRICYGDTASILLPNFTHLNYSWSNGDTTSNLMNITKTGLFTVSITDSNQCVEPYLDVVSIAVNAPVNANAGNDTMLCENRPFKLEGGDSISGLNYFYTWYSYPDNKLVSTNKSLEGIADTTKSYLLYLQQRQGGLNCSGWDTISISVINPNLPNLIDQVNYCYSDSTVQLDSLSHPYTPYTRFSLLEFNDSNTGAAFLNAKQLLTDSLLLTIKNAPGRYLFEGRNINSSCLATDTVLVIVNSEPKVINRHRDTLCQKRVLGLNIYSTPTLTSGALGSEWFGSGVSNNLFQSALLLDTTITLTYQGPFKVYGKYIDFVTLCSSIDSMELYVQQNPRIELYPRDSTFICKGDDLDISVKQLHVTSKMLYSSEGDGVFVNQDTIYSYEHGSHDASRGYVLLQFRTAQGFTERCVADTQFLKVIVNSKPIAHFEVQDDDGRDSIKLTNLTTNFTSGFYVINQTDTLIAQIGTQRFGKILEGLNSAQLWVKDGSGCSDSTSVQFQNLTSIQQLKLNGIHIPSLWNSKQNHVPILGEAIIRNFEAELFSLDGKRVQVLNGLPIIKDRSLTQGVYLLRYSIDLNQEGQVEGQIKVLVY